jgi:uncharacterized repeat protein (TIGR03803 family)
VRMRLANVCSMILVAAIVPLAQAQTFKATPFLGTNGSNPQAGLIQDTAGSLYGTTYYDGASGYGTVFKVGKNGGMSVLYNFAGAPDAANPSGALAIDSSGNLYGTTVWGGASDMGAVFMLDTTGQETILHSFAGGSDGMNPEGGVIRDITGNLFGATEGGGTGAGCGGYACGTIFKIDRGNNETILYSFQGDTASGLIDGAIPWAGLVEDAAGNLYGTTVRGGASGYGTVFELDTSGTETLLHSFAGPEGAYPYAGLILDASGNLYGTAYQGGSSHVGTVFGLNPNGKLTVLHNFAGNSDGAYPAAGLARDSSGNFYGTTVQGGSSLDYGTVFRIDSAGIETVLHSFMGGSSGMVPEAGVLLDKTGNLHGTSYYGGAKGLNDGILFELTP